MARFVTMTRVADDKRPLTSTTNNVADYLRVTTIVFFTPRVLRS